MLYGDYLEFEPRPQQGVSTTEPATELPVTASDESSLTHGADVVSILGNFLGGAAFLGGLFLLPYGMQQLLNLL